MYNDQDKERIGILLKEVGMFVGVARLALIANMNNDMDDALGAVCDRMEMIDEIDCAYEHPCARKRKSESELKEQYV